jgi:hypothetical protein
MASQPPGTRKTARQRSAGSDSPAAGDLHPPAFPARWATTAGPPAAPPQATADPGQRPAPPADPGHIFMSLRREPGPANGGRGLDRQRRPRPGRGPPATAAGLASRHDGTVHAQAGPDGRSVEPPEPMFDVLLQVAAAMKAGLAVTVAPHHVLLSTRRRPTSCGSSALLWYGCWRPARSPLRSPAVTARSAWTTCWSTAGGSAAPPN